MSSPHNPQNYYQRGQYQQPNPQYGYQIPMAQQYPQNTANDQDLFKPLSQQNSQPPMLQSFNPYNQQQEVYPGWQYLASNQQPQIMQGKRNQPNVPQRNNPQGYQMGDMVQSSDSQKYIDQSVPYQDEQEEEGQQYYQQGQEGQQQGWSNKFFQIFQRFQWAYDRFEQLREMYSFLHNKLQTVDSQDDWNQFKSYHEQFYEKFEQMQYQMNTVMNENQRLMQANVNGQGQNANWQQRYKELLGNFKALQEESNVKIRQSHQNQDDNDRQNEIKQFNQLKDQYMKICNQMQAAQEHIEGLSNENEKYQQIIQSLQSNLTGLQQNNAMLQRQLASKPSISRQGYDKFNAVIDQKDAQIRKLKKELALKDNEIYSRIQQESISKNQQIKNLKRLIEKIQGQMKSSFSEDFNRILSMKSDQIAQYRKLLKSSQEEYELKLKQRQQQIVSEYEDKLNNLSTQLTQLQQRYTDDNPLASVKLASYEKKIAYYEQQIQNLNDMLNKKNQEINRLRDSTYELQNMKLLKNQKAKVEELNETLTNNLQNKNRELQTLKFQIAELETKLKEVNQKKNQANARGYMDEIKDLKDIITSKDREISKLRQTQQIKQKTINELQHENEISREKLITREKNYQMEKQQFRNEMRAKQSRNLDLERKIRNIQLDFGQSAKSNLLSEISTLRSQNQSKQQIIVKLQNQEIELKGQITHLERQKKDLDHEVRIFKTKNKQQLSIKGDLTRKIQTISIDSQSKSKIIRSLQAHQENLKSQIDKLQKQIIQAQNTLKSKNSVINQLQDKLQTLNDQYSETSRERDALKKQLRKQNDTHQKDIRQLKYKLQENQQLIKSGKLWSNLELKNNQNQQLIKKLKSDNEVLRNQLTKSLDGTKKSTMQYLASSQTSPDTQQENFLERRLRDFNHKLDEMMGRKVPIQQNSRINKENEFSNNDRQQIKTLKDRIAQLQQYCSNLQQRIGQSDMYIKHQSLNGVSIFNEQEKIYNEELQFHKKRAQQFEERIDSLLKINKELKSKLEALLKNNPDHTSSSSFYKNQLELAEKNIQSLNQRVRKLTEQNALLKKQSIQYTSTILSQYESRITEFQNTVQDLQRKIRQLQIEKVTTQNEKATLKHTITRLQSNIQIIKSSMSEKTSMYETMLQQAKNQYMSYDHNIKDMASSGSAMGANSRFEMR